MPRIDFERQGERPSAENQCPVSFDEALRCVVARATPIGTECVALDDAGGRVLAAPAIAQRTAPPVPVSAMDGYAVRDADLARMPVKLKIVGKSFAGARFGGHTAPGECVRIFTGAPLPPGTDRVVVQEDVTATIDGFACFSAISQRRHIRAAGSDFFSGETVVPSGRLLKPQHLIAAAAADLNELEVYRRPRVHILCCGDELVPAGSAQASLEKIPESISAGVGALIRHWGGQVSGRTLLPDYLGVLQNAAGNALRASDAIVIIGGASVGERDLAKQAFAPHDLRLVFKKVAIKPGKPVWFGEAHGKPIIGLPGNPTSALVTARLLLAPLIAGMTGQNPACALRWRQSQFEGPLDRCSGRDVFLRARMHDGAAHLLASQDSADQKTLAEADVLVRIRPQTGGKYPEALIETLDL
ncbi:MAG: molybdopterin molybdotransferase MoeA [Proteobacteria bacterium]|nr:molybdopterin molybdotransferase MoeA [Pseudomonadota bacterium]